MMLLIHRKARRAVRHDDIAAVVINLENAFLFKVSVT